MERITFTQINRKETASSQWSDLVGRFTEEYNRTTQEKYRISESRMAMKLSPLLKSNGIGWLEWFFDDCKKKDNFGRYFNYAINPKNAR